MSLTPNEELFFTGPGLASSTVTLCKIPRDIIEPIPAPKIKAPEPFDLDLLCRQAMGRVAYSIKANVDFNLLQMKQEFRLLKRAVFCRHLTSGDIHSLTMGYAIAFPLKEGDIDRHEDLVLGSYRGV